jgi:hypothetical protein
MKTIASLLLAFGMAAVSGAALAQGTEQQRAACRPDVRKFCHALREDAGTSAFQQCLEANRAKLSVKCRRVLDGED